MSEHFHAFSFVDRILWFQPGVNIRGVYAIPADSSFPMMLVAEAIGQCAAWMGMPAVEFKYRPVAGLVSRYEQFSSVNPGDVLELSADLLEVSSEALAYNGTASVRGVPVARMERSVAPLLPMEEFDDPAAVRRRFELIREQGAAPGAFRGVPSMPFERLEGEKGLWKKAVLRIPGRASFFADHFPRRPVFPGALLMGKNLDLASALLKEIPAAAPAASWTLRAVQNTKFRSFTAPDSILECEARLENLAGNRAQIGVEARDRNKLVASAKALFLTEPA